LCKPKRFALHFVRFCTVALSRQQHKSFSYWPVPDSSFSVEGTRDVPVPSEAASTHHHDCIVYCRASTVER
jgi:hypothetical protein